MGMQFGPTGALLSINFISSCTSVQMHVAADLEMEHVHRRGVTFLYVSAACSEVIILNHFIQNDMINI